MRYTNPEYPHIIIEANGGYRVLEKLGYKNEFQLAREERENNQKEKAKEFFEKCKKKKQADKEYLESVKKQVKNEVN